MNVTTRIDATQAMMADPRFGALVRARSRLGWTLTAVTLAIYYGFILLIAYDGSFLAQIVAGSATSLGLIIGLGVLLSTFILVAIYVGVANTTFDRMTAELNRDVAP